jgi:hypothetical protein
VFNALISASLSIQDPMMVVVFQFHLVHKKDGIARLSGWGQQFVLDLGEINACKGMS